MGLIRVGTRWACGLAGVVVAALTAALPMPALAQGHGPAFALSTPTLGKGAWSLDLGFMGRFAHGTDSVMGRPMGSYGVTENLQTSVSLPLPFHVDPDLRPARAMSRMPMSNDVEFVLGWRFHRTDLGVGSRFESTAFGGLTYPTVAARGAVSTSPGAWVGVATGYASRDWYVWVGGLHRRYLPAADPVVDRIGSSTMFTAAVGYRPSIFRADYPAPDWRVFLEVVSEWTGEDSMDGIEQAGTGGHQVFVGPTVLGIYGAWAVSGGPLFPVYRNLNGSQPRESVRVAANLSFWFF